MKKNRAPMIALFGPDGSGKSTVAELIAKRCEEIGVRSIRMHWRPGFLPYRKSSSQVGQNRFTSPHSTNTRGCIKSLLVFLYIAIDFIAGYYFLVHPRLRNGDIVIYERYYYDIIIDQKRYGVMVPLAFRTFSTKFIPIPDTIILLDALGDIMRKRKGELALAEIERQRLMMKKHLSRFDGFNIVDVGDSSPDEVADIIFQIATR